MWTMPAEQEDSDVRLAVGCKSCVRPVDAAHMTAGPDVVRGSGPDQNYGLDSPLTQAGFPDQQIDRLSSHHHHPRNLLVASTAPQSLRTNIVADGASRSHWIDLHAAAAGAAGR